MTETRPRELEYDEQFRPRCFDCGYDNFAPVDAPKYLFLCCDSLWCGACIRNHLRQLHGAK